MRRKGFSLIELLIVVAIIAALVGVAVPFFQDNLQEAQRTKAKQDLDVIRNAINLHDAQNRPLVGTDLSPLLGRYLQEMNDDPWGNTYLLDANVGILVTFGADAQADGTGPDKDEVAYYKSPLRIQRAQYDGPWGRPVTTPRANMFIITMTKPFSWDDPDETESTLQLLTNTRDYDSGFPFSLKGLDTEFGASQKSDWDTGNGNAANFVKPEIGVFAFGNGATVLSGGQSVTPTMSVNFATWADGTLMTEFGLVEFWLTNGPLDEAIYGDEARTIYQRSPESIPFYNGQNRGVKIERF